MEDRQVTNSVSQLCQYCQNLSARKGRSYKLQRIVSSVKVTESRVTGNSEQAVRDYLDYVS